ncbi:MAG: VWA domain-containing protein [Deltaproteobacteria bacterium]|nr:VWA domain-containing protein [Deltaproteobacteria bacterium]
MSSWSFSFLAAGALALAVLALGPLIAHLARQDPIERQAFGAMMLVERLVRRLRRRRRIQDPVRLAVRLLAVLLVVVATARPGLGIPDTALRLGGVGRVVVVLDNSLSMSLEEDGALRTLVGQGGASEGTLLARARREAVALVRELPPDARVGVVAVVGPEGGPERILPTLVQDPDRVVRALEAVQPSWSGTDLAGALREARSLLGGEPGEVVVFTDEAGPGTVAGAVPEIERILAAGGRVLPRGVQDASPRNVTVSTVTYGGGVEGGSLRVGLTGFGKGEAETVVTVTLPDGSRMTAFVQVPGCPGSDAPGDALPACEPVEVRFTVPPEVPGGVASVALSGDRLASDDTHWFHLPRVGPSRVLVVDGDPGPTPIQSEVYFLERALAPWGGLGTGVRPEVTAPDGVPDLDLGQYRVVFLANVSEPRPLADTLSAFVRGGGGLVITGGDNVTPERYNAALSTLLPAPLRRSRNLVSFDVEEGVPLVAPDTGEELFTPFARQGRAGFTAVRVRRAILFDPVPGDVQARTLLALEGGLPFLLERTVGRGRVFVLAGTVDLAWNDLPLQAVFLPFVQRLVTCLGGESADATARFEGTVGEVVHIPLPGPSLAPRVADPDGHAVSTHGIPGWIRFTPQRPGPYTVSVEGAPPLAWVAANPPAPESDVRRQDSLARAESALDPTRLQRRVELGLPALAGALLLMLLQAGGWTRHGG